jgi:hypothetical protein
MPPVRGLVVRAGAYVIYPGGSNVCPPGSTRITDELACQTAAATFTGTTWKEGVSYSEWPKGCYLFWDGNGVYFNRHGTGGGDPERRLLCALTTALPTLSPTSALPATSTPTGLPAGATPDNSIA